MELNQSVHYNSDNSHNHNDSNYQSYGDADGLAMSAAVHMYYYFLWTYIAPGLLGIITIIGAFGNGLVIYVILRGKVMCTVTNILLLNLAFTDIAFLLICVPFKAHKYAASEWNFGDTLCKVIQYFAYVTTYVTVWSLVSVSVLRFLTVAYSKRTVRFRTKTNIVILIISIWVLSFIVNIPAMLAHVTKAIGVYSYCGIHEGATEGVFISFFVFAVIRNLSNVLSGHATRTYTKVRTASPCPRFARTVVPPRKPKSLFQ